MLEIYSRLNFRDVGGLPTDNGGTVRPGVFYRSEGPKNFQDRHIAELQSLNIRSIFDLRSEGERNDHPHLWQAADCRVLHLDMNNDLRAASRTEWDRLRLDPDPQVSIQVVSQNYEAMAPALLPHWKQMADALLEGDSPAVVNCTAGKDRTGVAVALMLAMVGVRREAIIADYLKSDIFAKNLVLQGSIEKGFLDSFGFIPNQHAIDALIGVDRVYVESSLAGVDRDWGSVEGYFDAAGVDAAMRRALTDLFVAA